MEGYTNVLSNVLLNQYRTQMNSNNVNKANNANNKTMSNFAQEKAIQQMVFQIVLSKMMDSMSSMGGSMSGMAGSIAKEALLNNLTNTNSFGFDNSLNSLSNFSSSVRGAAKLVSRNDNNRTNNRTESNVSNLGIRASKYESNLNPAEISDDPGDYGGKSYGAWQFSSRTGSLNSFIKSLKGNNNDMYYRLTYAKSKDGGSFGSNFDAAWRGIARQDKDKFLRVQQNYVKENFYDVAVTKLKSRYNFDISKRSNALKESLWSTVVQHGVGGATSIFSKLNLNNSDGNIIKDLYGERQNVNLYFRSSSPEIRQSVYNRFTREKQDMLNMLNGKFV